MRSSKLLSWKVEMKFERMELESSSRSWKLVSDYLILHWKLSNINWYFQLKSKLSNFKLSNLKLSNFSFFSNSPFQLQYLLFNISIFQLHVGLMSHKLYDINIKSLTKLCHQHRCGRNMIWFKMKVFLLSDLFQFFLKTYHQKMFSFHDS